MAGDGVAESMVNRRPPHMLERLDRFCGVHSGLVLAVWLAAVLAAGWVWWSDRDDLSSAISPESASTSELFRAWVNAPPNPGDRHIVCASSHESATSQAMDERWLDLNAASAVALSEYTGRCYTAKWNPQGVAGPLAPGTPVVGEPEVVDTPSSSQPFPSFPPSIVEAWRAGSESAMSLTGIGDGVHADILRAERTALPFIVLILVVMIRNPILALLPLLNGLIVSVVATGVLIRIAGTLDISVHVLSIVTMFGLALGIDYSLLRIMRGRRAPASSVEASASGRDGARTSGTIVVAGVAVFGASLGLLAVPMGIFRDVALGLAIVVTVAVAAAITLVPALMRIPPNWSIDLCRVANWRGHASPARRPRWWGDRSWAWPVCLLAGLALASLVGLGWQATALRTAITVVVPQVEGQEDTGDPYDAYMEGSLIEVRLSSVDMVIAGSRSDPTLEHLLEFIGTDVDFAPVVLVDSFPEDDVHVLRAIVVRPADSDVSSEAVKRLRGAVDGIQEDDVEAIVLLGGPLATYDHVIHAIEERQIVAGLLSLVIAGGLMTILVRRNLVSLLATFGSLLSFCAAVGILVVVVQGGFAAAALGVEQAPYIESWVPIVLFCVLLGMGIDYHMFLVGSVLDAMADGHTTMQAIAHGYRTVGPVVIVAAITMATVFGGFVRAEMVAIQQLGIGLASGILLDALLVRLLIVPAIAILAGRVSLRRAVASPPAAR